MAMSQPVDIRTPAVVQRQNLMQRVVQNFAQDLQRRQQMRQLLQGGPQGAVSAGTRGAGGVGVRFNPTGALPGGGLGPSSRIAFLRMMSQQLPPGLAARLGPGGIDRSLASEHGPAPGSFADAARPSLPPPVPGLAGGAASASTSPSVSAPPSTAPSIGPGGTVTPAPGTSVTAGYSTSQNQGSLDQIPVGQLSAPPSGAPQGSIPLGNGLYLDPNTMMVHGSGVSSPGSGFISRNYG